MPDTLLPNNPVQGQNSPTITPVGTPESVKALSPDMIDALKQSGQLPFNSNVPTGATATEALNKLLYSGTQIQDLAATAISDKPLIQIKPIAESQLTGLTNLSAAERGLFQQQSTDLVNAANAQNTALVDSFTNKVIPGLISNTQDRAILSGNVVSEQGARPGLSDANRSYIMNASEQGKQNILASRQELIDKQNVVSTQIAAENTKILQTALQAEKTNEAFKESQRQFEKNYKLSERKLNADIEAANSKIAALNKTKLDLDTINKSSLSNDTYNKAAKDFASKYPLDFSKDNFGIDINNPDFINLKQLESAALGNQNTYGVGNGVYYKQSGQFDSKGNPIIGLASIGDAKNQLGTTGLILNQLDFSSDAYQNTLSEMSAADQAKAPDKLYLTALQKILTDGGDTVGALNRVSIASADGNNVMLALGNKLKDGGDNTRSYNFFNIDLSNASDAGKTLMNIYLNNLDTSNGNISNTIQDLRDKLKNTGTLGKLGITASLVENPIGALNQLKTDKYKAVADQKLTAGSDLTLGDVFSLSILSGSGATLNKLTENGLVTAGTGSKTSLGDYTASPGRNIFNSIAAGGGLLGNGNNSAMGSFADYIDTYSDDQYKKLYSLLANNTATNYDSIKDFTNRNSSYISVNDKNEVIVQNSGDINKMMQGSSTIFNGIAERMNGVYPDNQDLQKTNAYNMFKSTISNLFATSGNARDDKIVTMLTSLAYFNYYQSKPNKTLLSPPTFTSNYSPLNSLSAGGLLTPSPSSFTSNGLL
jgi:hypothetical protein